MQLPARNHQDQLIAIFAHQGITIQHAYRTEHGIPIPNWLNEDGTECVPGIYLGVPNSEYHAAPNSWSTSQLKILMQETPAHFHSKFLDPEAKQLREMSKAESSAKKKTLATGDLIHALALEPHAVYERYYCALNPSDYPQALRTDEQIKRALKAKGEPMTKSGEKKEDRIKRLLDVCPDAQIWDDLVANLAQENEGKESVAYATWHLAHLAIQKTMERSESAFLLAEGLPELSIFARDPATGLMFRIRPDILRTNLWMVDVKSTASASPDLWCSTASRFGYHLQEAVYCSVFEWATSIPASGFGFVAIEWENAQISEPYDFDLETKEDSLKMFMDAKGVLADCLESGEWQGYTRTGVTTVSARPFSRRLRFQAEEGGE